MSRNMNSQKYKTILCAPSILVIVLKFNKIYLFSDSFASNPGQSKKEFLNIM
jgi:hypothetical protein